MNGTKLREILTAFCPTLSGYNLEDLESAAKHVTAAVLNDGNVLVHDHLTLDGLREGYDLAERENDNLRAIISWVGQWPDSAFKEQLAEKIEVAQGLAIEDGGIVENLADEGYEELRALFRSAERAADLLDAAVDAKSLKQLDDSRWFVAATTTASNIRSSTQNYCAYFLPSRAISAYVGKDALYKPVDASIAGVAQAVVQVERDAERWRALMHDATVVRLRGPCPGFVFRDTVTLSPEIVDCSLGVEFFYSPHGTDVVDARPAKAALTLYADTLVADRRSK